MLVLAFHEHRLSCEHVLVHVSVSVEWDSRIEIARRRGQRTQEL